MELGKTMGSKKIYVWKISNIMFLDVLQMQQVFKTFLNKWNYLRTTTKPPGYYYMYVTINKVYLQDNRSLLCKLSESDCNLAIHLDIGKMERRLVCMRCKLFLLYI